MDLPRQFKYGPRWELIYGFFAAGVALLALASVHVLSFAVGAGLGILPLAFALTATVRRLVFLRSLELGQDALSIGTGFLQARVTTISYADIEQCQEVKRGRMSVLKLRTKARTVEIASVLLPDQASYEEVSGFLRSRLARQETGHAGQPQPREIGKYCFRCSYEGNGEIYDSNGDLLWRFKTQHFHGRPRYPYGFFRLPDFVVADATGAEVFTVKFSRKWVLAQFVMVENDSVVCSVKLQSILRNKYTLDFAGGHRWVFRMPLFTVLFRGVSEAGDEIRVRMWSHNVWYVQIDPNADNSHLAVALAFIHRERIRWN